MQKYVSELLEYSIGELRQQIDEMQLKTDVMRGQIQKFKMFQYSLLGGVMLGLVLPAGPVPAFFSHGNHYTDDVLSLDQECVVLEVIYICYYFHPSTIMYLC